MDILKLFHKPDAEPEQEAEYTEIPNGSSPKGGPSRRNKSRGRSVGYKIPAAVILVFLLIIYAAGVYYYSGHFLRSTYVNNIKVGGMTVGEAEKTFTDDLNSHKIAVKEKERTEVIDPNDIGAVIAVGSQISDLKKSQNHWAWFAGFFGRKNNDITLDVTYDEAALTQAIDSLECFAEGNVQAPKNAYIKAGDKAFEIVPEVLGNTVKKQELSEKAAESLKASNTSIDLEKEGLYKLPTAYAEDENVKKALEKANKFTAGSISYDFKYTKENLNYSTTKDWINISKKFKVSIDESKVGDYVEALGAKYNTMGSSRDFTTAYGKKIHVFNGDYGWKIYFDKEKQQLIKDLKSGKDVAREPIYSYTAMCRNSARDDIGDSYVEVSIANQEVWLFIDGKCVVDTSCVTGNPTLGHNTYTGVYSITYKKSPDVLTGPNSNGTSYSSKVTYWMPFNGNQGLHDATWRDSFGGSIYRSNGSHGCVNLPYDAAAAIYPKVKAGFPVVIY